MLDLKEIRDAVSNVLKDKENLSKNIKETKIKLYGSEENVPPHTYVNEFMEPIMDFISRKQILIQSYLLSNTPIYIIKDGVVMEIEVKNPEFKFMDKVLYLLVNHYWISEYDIYFTKWSAENNYHFDWE